MEPQKTKEEIKAYAEGREEMKIEIMQAIREFEEDTNQQGENYAEEIISKINEIAI